MIKFDFNRTPITQIADYIIISSAKSNASDIHFDPREDGMMVRIRVDGDLQNFTFIPKAYERNLTTRLKLLANMNITESRLPQDGAIKGNFGGTYLDMRVSCLPLNEGEKIVIRILDYTRSLQGLDSLGFNESNLQRLKRMIQVPNGIILITGATGSGKSTTVYSVLETLNREETNIITVEDPIEMNIEGLNQVQVNSEIGMTFAAALRSILRQDPNVILIGEIRDSETAQIAVRAAITGHLVLSTIHTNNTLSTVERLLDMNVERYLLSTALTGIISQRLAKKICTKCRVERETTKFEKKVFKKYMHKDVDKIWDVNEKGCDACRKGYKGRVAIQEVLELDDEIRNALNNENLSKEDLSNLVYSDKVITMLQDALGKVLDGTTSFEEVLRVIEIEDAEDFFESDVAEKVKEEEIEKDKKREEELEAQEKKQEETKEKEKEKKKEKETTTPPTNSLEVVSLNTTQKKETDSKSTPRTIPTTTTETAPQKTTSANNPVNTLEKINEVEEKKQQPIEPILPKPKADSANTPVNTLEKIKAIDEKKQQPSSQSKSTQPLQIEPILPRPKANSANTPVNTIEKINTIEAQKNKEKQPEQNPAQPVQPIKADSANTPVNTLEKINTIETQKQQKEVTQIKHQMQTPITTSNKPVISVTPQQQNQTPSNPNPTNTIQQTKSVIPTVNNTQQQNQIPKNNPTIQPVIPVMQHPQTPPSNPSPQQTAISNNITVLPIQ